MVPVSPTDVVLSSWKLYVPFSSSGILISARVSPYSASILAGLSTTKIVVVVFLPWYVISTSCSPLFSVGVLVIISCINGVDDDVSSSYVIFNNTSVISNSSPTL